MFLFVALFSASFDINESRAIPQCCNLIDDDGDGNTDFLGGDLQCISSIDEDETVLGGNYYISFQGVTIPGVSFVTNNCAPRVDCATFNGDVTGCATGWSCPIDASGSTCFAAATLSGTSLEACVFCPGLGTTCATPYAACDCTCPGVPTAGCAGGVSGDNDGDGDLCDPGETIFNCTVDCLDPGIPRVPFDTILERLIEWTLGFGLAIAVTFLIWSGVVYTASSGDAQKAENAKKVMKYSILGVLVIGISYAIITVLDTIFT